MNLFNPLDPLSLSRISNLLLRLKTVAQGTFSGIHRASYKGSSIEFLDHKEYASGDDIKQIDWRLFARSDKYYIKQFEEETNMRSHILLDTSASMGYRSTGISKFEYSLTLATSLFYILIKQYDAVGLLTFNDKIIDYIPPRGKRIHLFYLIDAIKKLSPSGKTNIGEILASFSEKVGRKGTIIIISDFFDDMQDMVRALRHYRYKRNDVILFQILDPYELDFPFDRPANFVSLEDEKSVFADPIAIKKDYLARLNLFIHKFKEECLANKIDHRLVNSSTPLEKILISFLSERKKANL